MAEKKSAAIPWLQPQESVEPETPKTSTFGDIFNNIEAWGRAAYADTRAIPMGREIKDVYDRIDQGQYDSSDEYDRLVSELDRLQEERNAYRNTFEENQKILNQNDSMLKDFTEIGGTVQGIGTQAKDTLIGAGVGALGGSVLPVAGTASGAMTGARVGNFVGSIHQAVQDADTNAVDAWEKVLQEGGSSEQAEQAYKDAFWNNMPTEALDIISSMYMGGKLVGSTGKILERALGNKLAGTLASGVNKVGRFDIPAKIGTAVAKATNKSWLGQGVGVGVSMLGNGLEEGIQEPWQDYATERAVDIQRKQYDPNHEGIRDFSVFGDGGLLDYYTTPEGRETAWKAAKMGMAFGGVGGLMSKSQFTELGTAHSDSIQAGKQQADWIEKHNILKDEGNLERYNEVKETMGHIYGLTEDEKADLSVEDVSRMYHEYYANKYGIGGNRQEQGAVTQADFLNEITGEETARRGLMGDTATKYIDEFSLRPDSETLQGIHDNEQVLSEEQVQDTLEQNDDDAFNTEANNSTINDETGSYIEKRKKKNEGKEGKKGTGGLKPEYGNWKRIDEGEDYDYGAQSQYRNEKTGRVALVTKVNGGYTIQDVTNGEEHTATVAKTLKDVKGFLKSKANQKTAFMSDGTQEQVQQALPKEDGVISEVNSDKITEDAEKNQWYNGRKIQSNKAVTVHSMQDLHDYYKSHKNLMSADLYAEVSRQMMRFGIGDANNTAVVLDLTNREAGGFGSKTVFRTDPNDPNSAIARAVVRLYAGADLATAAHEIAHLGWMNLSDQDRATFAKWATKTQGEFVAKVLGMNYDQNFRSYLIEALTNRESETSKALWDRIKREGAIQQTLGILNGQDTELAVEERFAWEFSNWYAQGYIKGSKPRNIIERILNKACATLQGALNLLSDTNRYLNGEDGYNGGEINSIFTNMSTERIGQPRQTVAPQEQVETVTRMDYAPEMGYDLAQGLPNVADSELGFNLDEEPEQNLSGNVGTTRVNQKTQKAQQQKIKTGYGDNVSNQETLEQYKERMKQEAEQRKEEKKQNYTPTPQYQPKERNRKVGGYEQTSPHGETLEQYRKREAEEAEKYKVPTSLKAFRKLLTIVKNRKEGWQRALQSLRQVDPKKFRSIKTQIGNDLWGVSEDYVNDGNDLWGQPKQQSLFGEEFEETKSEPKTQVEENTKETKKTNTVEEPSLFDNQTEQVSEETDQGNKTSNKSVEKVDLTSDNQSATMVENQEGQEVADSGKTENTRGTEDLQGNVGEVQGRGKVRTGDDLRTGERRVGQDAVEGRSEGNGKDISLLKNKAIKDTYNKRKDKKTELKDWRNLSDSDELKQIYVDALMASKQADIQHGVYVDEQSVEKLKDCKVILHKNKMAGFAITKDGNLTGVFSNPKNPIRGILGDMVYIAHEMGAKKGDCFGTFLMRGYRAYGFTPVARIGFNETFYPESDPANKTIREQRPDVFVLVRDNDNSETYLNKINNEEYKNDVFDENDIYFIDTGDNSYNDAMDFQGRVLKETQKKENKNKSTKEVADSLRPKEETVTETQETTEQTQEEQTETKEEPTEQVQEEETMGNNNKEWFEDMKPYFNGKNTSEKVLSKTGDYRIVKRGYKVVDENGKPYGKVKYSYDVDQLGMEIDGEYGLESSFPTNDEAKKYLAERVTPNTESNKSQAETPVQSSTVEQPVATKSEPVVAKNETTENEKNNKEQVRKAMEQQMLLNREIDDIKGDHSDEKISYEEALNKFNEVEKKINSLQFPDSEQGRINNLLDNLKFARDIAESDNRRLHPEIEQAEKQKKIEEENKEYNGFLDNMSPMTRGKTIKQLSQKRNYGKDGGIMTKKAFIEKEVKNDSVFMQYITGDGYYLQYDDGTQRKIQQTDALYYQHLSDQIREKEEAEKEQKRQEKRKDMPEDRWSKYRNKDGNIESDSEGVHHDNGDEIESPIFDIYDDPDSVSDAKDYIDALVSYDPSGTLLSNLKRKINDYQNTKNPVGEVEYWDDAIEAIEEEQENRKDNDGYVSADDNGSPWTSRMIMDNMKEHAEYLQKQNEEESEVEEQTSPETKTTTEAKPKKTTTKTQTSPKTETTTTQDKSDKKYQRAVELVLNNRGMSPVGLRLALEQEGINVGYVGAEKYLTQMEEDGLVEGAGEGSMRIPIDTTKANKKTKKGNNPDTHMQEAGQAAENQTLLTPEKEAELEKLFWKLIRKKEFHGMDKRWSKDSLDYYRSLYNRMQGKDFNPEYVMEDKAFLTAIKNVNDYINKNYKEYKNLYRGVDGHWRFEFSDKDAHFLNGFEKLSGKTLDTTLEKILKHDNLYKFYSKLKEMPVHLVRNEEMQRQMEDTENNYYAMYDPETKSIYINSDMFEQDDVRNSLLHEIQHAIQDIEGFANGTNDNAYNNNYDFSEGEKQAVLTEKRSNMSDEELEKNPRYETLNPEEKTIMSEQRPVKKAAKSPDTKMQSNGQTNLGYIDKQKDIYSVTFTKSAQKNGENQKKIAFYRNNKSYWRENKDAQTGSITFTRALPYRQHQKTIIYDDINGKTVGRKKKTKVREYIEAAKDQIIKWLFNDKHFLKKAARNVGAIEAYMRMMVMKDQGAVAGAAIEDGIVKHNGKNGERTKSLNSIIEAVGEENQTEFLKYCEAYRVLDLEKRNIYQKMTPKDARDEIAKVQRSKNAKLFEEQRKNFVEYNHELLWVLVDGGFITEKQYDKFIQNDPNFIPLSKNMDELEGYVDGFRDSKTMINVQHPMHKIGTSMGEVANPFLEMQKRTVEYYVKASRNKAGLIFVHDIAEAIAQTAGGNVVAQNQGMIRKLASRDKNGKPISHDNKQYVFYVWENGQKQYYQVADREIYVALKSFDAEQMGALSKIMNQTAGRASRLVRNTATMTPDFGLRNLVRDNVEAFISSEHGFLPLVDSLWGMYQMANDTQWFREYQALNGEHMSLNRDGEDVATVEHDIKDNVKFYKSIVPLFKKDLHEFMDKKRSVPARLKSLLKLVALDILPLQALYKGNKRLNDYLETGTRIGEYRNARMGYRGLYGRLFEGKGNTIFTNDADLKMAQMDKMFAAYKAKDITLNFGQHGVLGKELNRYIPFFNASLQGIYKVCNTLENMVRADDTRLKQELWFKFVLMGAMGMAAAMAGQGDDDYDEAPDYEHDNFWILPNGIRIPKDQLFGRLVGGTVEKATRQYLRDGDVKKLELLKDILGNFVIDKSVPALVDLAWGTVGNYDSFKGRSVTPEYMADRWGYLQKDLSTSKIAADISEGLLNVFGFDVGAKKVDFVISKTLSNLGNYTKNLYELGTNPSERMTRGAEPEDKGGFAEWSKELPYPLNTVIGTFATNRNTFQSLSDFYNRYKELKKFESAPDRMSKAEKKVWEAYKKAYKDDKKYRDALKAIKTDKSLTGAQKRERADKIFKQQIRMARKLRDYEKKQGLI